MSAHTPGPWSLDDAIHDHVKADDYHSIDAGQGFTPQGFGLQGMMSLANARLIAAAPELLAALIVAESFLSIAVPERAIDRNEAVREVLPQVRAAIAKATGAA